MFKKNTFITRGIHNNLNVRIITALWEKLQSVERRKLDYLQVFELRNCGDIEHPAVEVVWTQEVPKHKEVFILQNEKTEVDRVWVICEGEGSEEEYSTMLLPEEY